MFERKEISKELSSFTKSSQFKNFEAIMEDLAAAKFVEIQSNAESKSHADLIADRKVLNFYMNLPKDIKFRYTKLLKEKERESERS